LVKKTNAINRTQPYVCQILRIARASKIKFKFSFLDFGPNRGPGRLPSLYSGRGDIEYAGVLASVASVAVSFVSELISSKLVNQQKMSRTRPGKSDRIWGGEHANTGGRYQTHMLQMKTQTQTTHNTNATNTIRMVFRSQGTHKECNGYEIQIG